MKFKRDFIIFALIVFCCIIIGEANWCTRSKSEHVQHQVTVMKKCNQTYEDSCSFFSWDTCTYSELVDCPVKKNITVTRYFLVEVCCPGFKLDPANNITCIPSSEESDGSSLYEGTIESLPKPPKPPKVWYEQTTTVASVEKDGLVRGTENERENNVIPTTSGIDGGDDGDGSYTGETGHAVDDDDDSLLFGLSHGAYAGIICTLLFLICVTVLIMLHVRKRSRKNAAKQKVAKGVEMETTQKMLNVPA